MPLITLSVSLESSRVYFLNASLLAPSLRKGKGLLFKQILGLAQADLILRV